MPSSPTIWRTGCNFTSTLQLVACGGAGIPVITLPASLSGITEHRAARAKAPEASIPAARPLQTFPHKARPLQTSPRSFAVCTKHGQHVRKYSTFQMICRLAAILFRQRAFGSRNLCTAAYPCQVVVHRYPSCHVAGTLMSEPLLAPMTVPIS